MSAPVLLGVLWHFFQLHLAIMGLDGIRNRFVSAEQHKSFLVDELHKALESIFDADIVSCYRSPSSHAADVVVSHGAALLVVNVARANGSSLSSASRNHEPGVVIPTTESSRSA